MNKDSLTAINSIRVLSLEACHHLINFSLLILWKIWLIHSQTQITKRLISLAIKQLLENVMKNEVQVNQRSEN